MGLRSSNVSIPPFAPQNGNSNYALNVTAASGAQALAVGEWKNQIRIYNSSVNDVYVAVLSVNSGTIVIPAAAAMGSAVGANGVPVRAGETRVLSFDVTPVVVLAIPTVYFYAIAAVAGPSVVIVSLGEGN